MSAHGLVARGLPPWPAWLLYVKIAILVLSLVVLALAAWAISIAGGWVYGTTGAAGLLVFAAVWSFIVYGGSIILQFAAPSAYFRIAGLVLYILAIIFWLSAWAYGASAGAAWLAWTSSYYGGFLGDYVDSSNDPARQLGQALAACAGIGALVWILTIVHLAFFIRACVKDPEHHQQAELGNVKQSTPVAGGQQTYPQQTYPAQGYPAQQYPAQQQYPGGQQQYPGTQQPYATQ